MIVICNQYCTILTIIIPIREIKKLNIPTTKISVPLPYVEVQIVVVFQISSFFPFMWPERDMKNKEEKEREKRKKNIWYIWK